MMSKTSSNVLLETSWEPLKIASTGTLPRFCRAEMVDGIDEMQSFCACIEIFFTGCENFWYIFWKHFVGIGVCKSRMHNYIEICDKDSCARVDLTLKMSQPGPALIYGCYCGNYSERMSEKNIDRAANSRYKYGRVQGRVPPLQRSIRSSLLSD